MLSTSEMVSNCNKQTKTKLHFDTHTHAACCEASIQGNLWIKSSERINAVNRNNFIRQIGSTPNTLVSMCVPICIDVGLQKIYGERPYKKSRWNTEWCGQIYGYLLKCHAVVASRWRNVRHECVRKCELWIWVFIKMYFA